MRHWSKSVFYRQSSFLDFSLHLVSPKGLSCHLKVCHGPEGTKCFEFSNNLKCQIKQPQNLQHERKTSSRKIHGSYKYWKIVKITANICKHNGVFYSFWQTLSKRNKKCEICYKNFALWKIETIADVKHQKQLPRDICKIS